MEVLLFAVGTQRCALPLKDVAEVMRGQPLTSHGLLTPGVLGTAIIRGRPTPVVDAGVLLTGNNAHGDRLVLLRVEGRPVALAVDRILGTARLSHGQLTDTPALLNGNQNTIEAIGVLDAELVNLLNTVRLLGEAHAHLSPSEPTGEQRPTEA